MPNIIEMEFEVDDKKGTAKVRKFYKTTENAETKTKKFGSAVGKASRKLGGMAMSAAKATGKIAAYAGAAGVGMAVVGLYKLKGALTDVIGLANAQEEAETKLAAVLKSTGNAAGFTSDELKKMASDMQAITTTGDEVILNAMAIQATFKNIKGDEFRRTTKAALDMSKVMGQDLKSSTVMLGKALNDPIANLSALSRSGVQFTESQKEMIKTMWEAGDRAGAQKIILAELESQFGGAATAATKTFGGAMAQLSNVWGDLKEQLGFAITKNEYFVELIHRLKDTVKSWIGVAANWIEANQELINQKIAEYVDKFATAAAWAKTNWEHLVGIMKGAITVVRLIAAGFNAVGKAIGWALAKAVELFEKFQRLKAVRWVADLFSKKEPSQPEPSSSPEGGKPAGSFQSGTGLMGLPYTGAFKGHQGEIVLSPSESDEYRRNQTNRSGGNVSKTYKHTSNYYFRQQLSRSDISNIAVEEERRIARS